MITDRHRNRGCTPFLTDAFSPPIALNTDDVSQIVPSCLVPQNFEIQVLSLGKMTSAIIEKFADSEGKAIQIPKIKYLAPNPQQNAAVNKFLDLCLLTSKLTTAKYNNKFEVVNNLENPLGNVSFNHSYINGFANFGFKITTKKKEQPFVIAPKYVQIQAALYLGCRRLSVFSYSEPMPYQTTVDFSQAAKLKFWKKQDHIQILQRQIEVTEEMVLQEERGEQI